MKKKILICLMATTSMLVTIVISNSTSILDFEKIVSLKPDGNFDSILILKNASYESFRFIFTNNGQEDLGSVRLIDNVIDYDGYANHDYLKPYESWANITESQWIEETIKVTEK